MLNKYEKSAARCLRAADQVNDAVLRFGFRNMARAWLDLAKKKKMPAYRYGGCNRSAIPDQGG
jgi:hypothetical protein